MFFVPGSHLTAFASSSDTSTPSTVPFWIATSPILPLLLLIYLDAIDPPSIIVWLPFTDPTVIDSGAVIFPLWNFTPPMLLWAFPVVVTAPFSIFTDPIVLFVTRLVPVILPPSCNPTPWMESIYLGFPSSSNTESHCTIPAVFVFNCLTFTASKSFSPAFTLVIRRWSGESLVLAALPTEIVSASSAMLPAPNATEPLARATALCPNAVAPSAVALLCCPNALLCTPVARLSSPIAVAVELVACAWTPIAIDLLPVTKLPLPNAMELSAVSPCRASILPGTMPAASYSPNVSVLASAAANAISAFSAADAAFAISKVVPLALRAPFSIVTPPIIPLSAVTSPVVYKLVVATTVSAYSLLTLVILLSFASKVPVSVSAWTENPIPAVSTKAANAATTLLPARLVVLFVQLWANSDVTTYWCFTLLQMTL